MLLFSCNLKSKKQKNAITLTSDTIFFSKINYNDTLSAIMHCRNNSTNDIKILGIENACGCTSGDLNDSIIKPNDSILVKITYIPKISEDSGKVLKFLSLRTNSDIPFINIILKGEIFK